MRDNDLLDGAWDAPANAPPPPSAWKRKSCRELDALMGIHDGEYEENDIFVARPISKPAIAKPEKAKASPKRRKRRTKATRVKPEDAQKLLDLWVKKLLTARRKVQKYRQTVKRYQKQGKL
jgi:hypothetical protein